MADWTSFENEALSHNARSLPDGELAAARPGPKPMIWFRVEYSQLVFQRIDAATVTTKANAVQCNVTSLDT